MPFIPVPTLADLKQLLDQGQKRKKTVLVGLLLVRADSSFTSEQILPKIDFWNVDSPPELFICCVGYSAKGVAREVRKKLSPELPNWTFSNSDYVEFVHALEANTQFQSNGTGQLILINANILDGRSYLDLERCMVLNLENLVEEIHEKIEVDILDRFFSRLFSKCRSAAQRQVKDPAWRLSDELGLERGRRELVRELICEPSDKMDSTKLTFETLRGLIRVAFDVKAFAVLNISKNGQNVFYLDTASSGVQEVDQEKRFKRLQAIFNRRSSESQLSSEELTDLVDSLQERSIATMVFLHSQLPHKQPIATIRERVYPEITAKYILAIFDEEFKHRLLLLQISHGLLQNDGRSDTFQLSNDGVRFIEVLKERKYELFKRLAQSEDEVDIQEEAETKVANSSMRSARK